ncbi:MAG: MBL fold metallo-hydrolase [bacterium]
MKRFLLAMLIGLSAMVFPNLPHPRRPHRRTDRHPGAQSQRRGNLPESFPQGFKEGVRRYGAKCVEVGGHQRIFEGVYTTGEMGGWVKEQSLMVESKGGLIVVTGCAHPGIVKIVERAKELMGEDICLALGGFHLSGSSDEGIRGIIEGFKRLGVRKVAHCHCTGERAALLFEDAYRGDFVVAGAGRVLRLEGR